MMATVEHFCKKSKGVRVMTETKKHLMAYPWNNPHRPGPKVHYPIRTGYASRIMRFQGESLPHATV